VLGRSVVREEVAEDGAAGSDIAVQMFLAFGVGLSAREPDQSPGG
jgi:hypothetical protein